MPRKKSRLPLRDHVSRVQNIQKKLANRGIRPRHTRSGRLQAFVTRNFLQ